MSDFSQMEPGFDPRVFDRLVDGELPEPERREVLLTLDRQPDGWRQCALAFLEAQTWGQTLTQYVREPSRAAPAGEFGRGDGAASSLPAAATAVKLPAESVQGDGNVPASRTTEAATAPVSSSSTAPSTRAADHSALAGRWRSTLAVAGSFLVTFSLGMYAQRYFSAPGAGQMSALTSAQPVNAGSPGIQMVDVELAAPNGQKIIRRLPAIDKQFAPFFAPAPTQASPEMSAIVGAGREVRIRREFRLVQVNDRQVLVPIDWLEVVPSASNRGVQ